MVEEEEDNRHKRMVRILRDLPADSEGSLGSQKSRNDESSIKDFSDFTDSIRYRSFPIRLLEFILSNDIWYILFYRVVRSADF